MAKSQAVPRVEFRAYPADRAIALFGVGSAALAQRRVVVEGQRASVIRFGRLALVVAYVDPNAFAPGEVERRRGDRLWMMRQARRHERVLERICGTEGVVPAPLLTIYPGLQALESVARESYSRWSRTLSRLTGKAEYTVHVFSGPHAIPDAEPYTVRVSTRSSRTPLRPKAVPTPTGLHVQALWDACAKTARAIRRINGAGARGHVMSAAVLVDENESNALRKTLDQLGPVGQALGLSVYLEGPRLPFTFG